MANNFQLPGKIEKVLATLSEYYKRSGDKELNRIIVNSSYRVTEEWTYDNWDGGTYGHAITFHVPAEIYYQILDNLAKVAENIGERLNKFSTGGPPFRWVPVCFKAGADLSASLRTS